MNTENKSTELDNTDKKLHISDVIPRYKFGTYHRDNETQEYNWFIIDTETDKIVEKLKDVPHSKKLIINHCTISGITPNRCWAQLN